MTECGCDFKTGECQGPLGCELRTENERLTKERDLALANADAVYARLMPEIERLRAALGEALDIAVGSGGDFGWQVRERLTELRAYQQQPNTEK